MPDYCPKLDTLYDLILSVLLRVPIGIAEHVQQKCQKRFKRGEDQTNFIAELRPVLEELKLSVRVETLDLKRLVENYSGIWVQAREFTQLLHIYISSVLIPDKDHLKKSSFDRVKYLQRLNRFNFLSAECSSIGSILKCEYKNFRAICSSSKFSNPAFLSFLFAERLLHLLGATGAWFESQITSHQNSSSRFMKSQKLKMSQIRCSMSNCRDKSAAVTWQNASVRDQEQSRILREMLIGLRTKSRHMWMKRPSTGPIRRRAATTFRTGHWYRFQGVWLRGLVHWRFSSQGLPETWVFTLDEFELYVHSVALSDYRQSKSSFSWGIQLNATWN